MTLFVAIARSVGTFGKARKDWLCAFATRNCDFQRASFSPTPTFFDQEEDEPDFPNPMVKVAILGPPNAGKSTLFNRLLDKELNRTYRLSSEKGKDTRRRKQKTGRAGRFSARQAKKKYAPGNAIVSPVSGTTRDRREGIGRIGGQYFQLVDTAGVDGERLDHFFDVKKAVNQKKKTEATPEPRKRRKKSDKPVVLTESPNPQEILKPMMQQALLAAQEAHLVFLMFDARVGLTSDFHETARWLRKHATSNKMKQLLNKKDMHKPVIPKKRARVVILANKLEGQAGDFLLQDDWDDYSNDKDEYRSPIQDNMLEAMRIGFDEVIPISALHGEGIADIAVEIARVQEELTESVHSGETNELEQDETHPLTWKEKPLQLAVLGRVNVGKSTLVNALLQQERVITGPTPGLTRDSISVPFVYGRDKRPVQLVDTAGLRKKPSQRTDDEIEDMAVLDALRAMKIADVAILVLDAQAKYLQKHELSIAQAVLQEGRALVIVANKMDLLLNEEYTRRDFERGVRQQLEDMFPMLRKTPIVAVSSLYRRAVEDIMPAVFDARARWERKISTAQLNRWMMEVVQEYAPPAKAGIPTRIKYMIQTKGRPPTFLMFCNSTDIPDSYMRYLTRHFQESFDFYGMDVRLIVKKSAPTNPFRSRRIRNRGGKGIGGREARKKRFLAMKRDPRLKADLDRLRRARRRDR